MIIDVHAHIFPDAIARKGAQNTSKFYGIPMQSEDGRLSTLLKLQKEAGIDFTVICSAATSPQQTDSINRFIADTVRAHPNKLIGLGTAHQDNLDKAAIVKDILSLGLMGVKLHPDIQGVALNDKRLNDLYEAMAGKLILLLHTGDTRYHYSNPPEFADVLKAHPDLTVIGAHFGCWSNWTEGVKALKKYDNLYVDCSSSLYALSPEQARKIIREYGAERVLFGSDFPMWTPEGELRRLEALGLTDAETEAILCGNAKRLFSL